LGTRPRESVSLTGVQKAVLSAAPLVRVHDLTPNNMAAPEFDTLSAHEIPSFSRVERSVLFDGAGIRLRAQAGVYLLQVEGIATAHSASLHDRGIHPNICSVVLGRCA
jgi:hypothetical protein